jgi:hypothetical protein
VVRRVERGGGDGIRDKEANEEKKTRERKKEREREKERPHDLYPVPVSLGEIFKKMHV